MKGEGSRARRFVSLRHALGDLEIVLNVVDGDGLAAEIALLAAATAGPQTDRARRAGVRRRVHVLRVASHVSILAALVARDALRSLAAARLLLRRSPDALET